MVITYRGFSTQSYASLGATFSLTDLDLINLDILNHIYTQRGERVMMPNFGTNIPGAAHELLTRELVESIRDDLEQVFQYDPRVEKLRLVITPYYDTNSLVASATLRYVELNVVENLSFVIRIDNNNE